MKHDSPPPNQPKLRTDVNAEAAEAAYESSLHDRHRSGRKNDGYKSLIAWQRSIQLGFAVCELTAHFPAEELWGLSSQMRRAAISCPSNIAEGYGRASTGEFKQFLGHARGSSAEIETQLLFAKHLGLGSADAIKNAERLCGEVSRLLTSLMRSLKT